MKRFAVTLLCSLALLSSCGNSSSDLSDAAGNPLSECVFPSSAHAGGELIVQWNGFRDSASLILMSTTEYSLDVRTVTSSGLIAGVPSGIPAGVYMLVLEQEGGRIELGTVEILDAVLPVMNLNLPSGAELGGTVLIGGIGFADDAVIEFVDADGNSFTFDPELVSGGLSVVIPEDLAQTEYDVYLFQDGGSWLISDGFSVYRDIVIKSLSRIEWETPYIGTAFIRLAWEISREVPVTLTVSESLVDGEDISLEAYDEYVCGENGAFELEHDGFEASNDLRMSYLRSEDGLVYQSDVLLYGKSSETAFTWTYNADGFLEDISSPTRSFRSFEYSEGNLTVFRNTSFKYEDPSLVNSPYAPDVVWGYMSLTEKNDPFVYIPYLLGWYTKASASLPTAILQPAPSGSGNVESAVSYEFDSDGYVTSMSWSNNKVGYFYE